jgi:transposase
MLSTFVLITNKLDEEALSNQEVLRNYKGQLAAENRFRLIKDSQMIDAICLKTSERVEALGIVYVMALLIYGILEYRVRKELKEKNLFLILKGKKTPSTHRSSIVRAIRRYYRDPYKLKSAKNKTLTRQYLFTSQKNH